MKVIAIIPAAGSGVRMQHASKKPYIELQGMTILGHTLYALNQAESIISIVIAVAPGDEDLCRRQILSGLQLRPEVSVIAGGQRRQDSVANALEAIASPCDVVLIHDGARPFVSPASLEETALAAFRHGAATAAVRVKDTIMQVDAVESNSPEPLQRDRLYAIQTPQAFRPDIIKAAHAQARLNAHGATDDASLVRTLGLPVVMTQGSYENIKITTVEDLVYAAAIFQCRVSSNRR